MIYVLLLDQGKIYVGHTERPIGARFIEHFNYSGSKWTELYRPKQVLRVMDGGLKEENELTIEMMHDYGWWNVRGGSWCQVEMNACPPALLEYQRLKLPTPLQQAKPRGLPLHKRSPINSCNRCGRTSHLESQCLATTCINGEQLEMSESDYSVDEEGCFRCGRDSHFANSCYARTDVNGNFIA